MSLSDPHELETPRRLVAPLATLHTLLYRWYHLTTPPVPGPAASRQERESARQAQLTSTIILGVALAMMG